MSEVNLVWITPNAEAVMAYCARVSSPNQENPEYAGLLKYCAKNRHWSVFEMANICLEIKTSRGISPQILRHRSFSFQEFSQRYAAVDSFEPVEARRQDTKNRQNSTNDLPPEDKAWFEGEVIRIQCEAMATYNIALEKGIAKESARFILPTSASTRLYMNGSVRSWIHYIELRSANGTQKEHQDIALACKRIVSEQLPTVAKALGWTENG